MEQMIIAEGVTKSYKGVRVLNNVCVSFERGKIHGIIGRNGSGKTMLIKAICGLVELDKGRIIVNNKVIGKDVDFPENTGVIIEAPGFLPSLTAYNNLAYLASLKNIIGKEEICRAMALVGLDPKEKKHVGKYSLGMKQRLGLAQAIMENPDILILDEPMNGLDKKGVSEVRDLLLKLKSEKKTILLVSHNADDISILCENVYEMDAGEIIKL